MTNQTFKGCPDNYWRCDDGDCVAKTHLCDGIQDCHDKSDEIPSYCNKSAFVWFYQKLVIK